MTKRKGLIVKEQDQYFPIKVSTFDTDNGWVVYIDERVDLNHPLDEPTLKPEFITFKKKSSLLSRQDERIEGEDWTVSLDGSSTFAVIPEEMGLKLLALGYDEI